MTVGGGGGRSKNRNRSKNKNQKQDRLSPPVNDGVTNGGPNFGKDNEESKSGEVATLQNLNKYLLEQIKSLREDKVTLEKKLTQMESRVNQMQSLGEENGSLEEKLIQMQAQISSLEALRTNLQSERDNLHGERVQLKEQLEESRRETEQLKKYSEVCEREMESSHAVQSNLEAIVFELKDRIQVTSAEFEAACKAWKLEKDELLSQTVEARKESEKIIQKLHGEIDENQHLWNAEKTDLESTVAELQRKVDLIDNEAQSLKAQLNESESKLNDSKGKTKELYRKIKEDRHLWDAEKNDLEGTVGELKTKFDLMASEKLSVSRKNGELSTEVESLKSLLNKSKGTTQELHEKMEEGQNSWNAEKTNLESTVAQLQTKVDLIDNEKKLLSQKNAELSTDAQSLKVQWDAEKSNLESIVAELKTKLDSVASERVSLSQTNVELSNKAESLKVQLNELQSNLNDSKVRTLELRRETEKERCLWDVEKNNLEGTVKELQLKFDSIDGERELLSQKNTELSTEVQSLKTELVAAYDEATVHLNMIKEKEALDEKLMLQLSRNHAIEEELFSTKSSFEEMKEFASKGEQQIANLQSQLSAMEEEKGSQIAGLQGQLSPLTEAKMLTEEKNAELERVKLDLEEDQRRLKGRIRELEIDIKSLDADLEASRGMAVEKEGQLSCLQDQLSDLAEEKKCLEEKSNTLLTELNKCKLVSEEKVHLHDRIKKLETCLHQLEELNDSKERTLELCRDIEKDRCLLYAEKNNLDSTVAKLQTKLDLMDSERELLSQKNIDLSAEMQSLNTELVAAKSAYDTATTHLNNINEEKEALDEKLTTQLSRNYALELELLSTKSSLEEMKESASKGELQIANLQSQLLAVAEKKDGQIFDIQSQLSAMAEEKQSQLADLQDELSALTEAKMFLDEKNVKLEREILVSEEEQLCRKSRIRELETAIKSLSGDCEASMAIEAEKQGQLSGLQHQLSDLAAEKKCLEEKYNSLLTELNKLSLVSEENVHLQDRIKELETRVGSLTRDFECRDIKLQKFKSECQGSQLCAENGKPNGVHVTGEPNDVPGKPKPKAAFEKQKPKRYYAWPAVASTGALVAAVVTAYLKFLK